jgi:hypothetical protein
MPRPKSVTIKLTTKQRGQVKRVTGEDHAEMKFERAALAVKSAPKRYLPRRDGLGSLSPLRKTPLSARKKAFSARKKAFSARKKAFSARKKVFSARKKAFSARKKAFSARKKVFSARKKVFSARKKVFASR